jgi:hypothetical protein
VSASTESAPALSPRELDPLAHDANAFEHVRTLPVKQIRVDRVNPAVANRGYFKISASPPDKSVTFPLRPRCCKPPALYFRPHEVDFSQFQVPRRQVKRAVKRETGASGKSTFQTQACAAPRNGKRARAYRAVTARFAREGDMPRGRDRTIATVLAQETRGKVFPSRRHTLSLSSPETGLERRC